MCLYLSLSHHMSLTRLDPSTHRSDEDADRITADKLPPTATDAQKEERNATLRRIAKIARDQGNYLLACKKYSNSGALGSWVGWHVGVDGMGSKQDGNEYFIIIISLQFSGSVLKR